MKTILYTSSYSVERPLLNLGTELVLVRDKAFLGINNKAIKVVEKGSINTTTLIDTIISVDKDEVEILHYTGHSGEEGLEIGEDGVDGKITISFLKDLVKTLKNLKLVFLNSCYSEKIAKALNGVGIPYIIGTTSKVKDGNAAIVAWQFYSLLASKSMTISDTFYATSAILKDEQTIKKMLKEINADLSDSVFRGSIGKKESDFAWKLFAKKALSEIEEGWTLIPKFEQFEDKSLKCLFLFDLKYIEYYRQFKSYFANANNGNISVLGINDISNDQTIDKFYFEKTCTESHIIVHLIDARYKEFVNLTGYNFNTFQGKQYSICIDDDFKIVSFKEEKWFKNSEILIEMSFIKLSNEGKNSSFLLDKVIIPKFNEFILNITSRTDLSKLPYDLKAIPFTSEEAQFDKFDVDDQAFSYYFINGTENCTQELLIKKLKKSFTNESFETFYIRRSKQKENNIDAELFSNDINFWSKMSQQLNISQEELVKELMKGKSVQDICINSLKEKRDHGNVIVIIDNIKLSEFEHLILKDFKTKLGEKTHTTDFKIIVFASSYLGEIIDTNNKIDILPLKRPEFQRWKASDLSIKNHENFTKLSINNILNGTNKTQFRKNAMINICTTLGEANYLNTILDILDYSKD